MRLLHVTDFHFRQAWYSWLLARAETGEFDAICLSGDLLDMFPNAKLSLPLQVKWCREWIKEYRGCPLFLCSGNHDWWPAEDPADKEAEASWLLRTRRPKSVFVDGDSSTIAGFTIACKPWVGPMPATIRESSLPVILLAHAPPEGTRVALNSQGGDVGDFEIAEDARFLPPGSAILSGHVHDPDRWHDVLAGVTCFNPGVDDDSRALPNHVILNTTTRRAEFVGRDGRKGPVRF